MKASVATITLVGMAPMSQSRQHHEPKLEGETHDAYDSRTWLSKAHIEERAGKRVLTIPANGFRQCLADAAKYSKRQIPGQGKATWTAKFAAGIALLGGNPVINNVDPNALQSITIPANADGQRGSGKRVARRFPVIPIGWSSTFEVHVLDPIITKDIFVEMIELAGMFIGMGQFRPANLGTNGRFMLDKIDWIDNRALVFPRVA